MTSFPLESGYDNKRHAVKVGGRALALLSFQTLGVIYADLGTSPVYTLTGIWPAGTNPSEEDIIGGISAIVWSLILLPLVKYVIISLYFSTGEGEGGTFALFQGLYPPEATDSTMDRTLTTDSFSKPGGDSKGYHLGEKLRWPLLLWCLFGTSLTIADGIFTPAVSVTSAVAGIGIAQSSVISDTTPISIAILVVFFLVQRFGTAKLAYALSPVAFLWFLLIGVIGIYNITFAPGIFRAFDPSRAIMLFVRTRDYDLLAGVLLAVTGCEATFASVGHFNAASIRISFPFFVFPTLCFSYMGQGARIIHDGPTILANPFFLTIPGPQGGPFYWIVFVVTIIAVIIASQTLVTATFSLAQQLTNMKSLPSLRMQVTSDTVQGQVYVPVVNYLLLILCVTVVGAFKSSVALTNAFGFAVATVMFSTSILLAIQIRYVKRLPIYVALAYLLFFGFIDGLFWGAALKKVPHGAWVPLMIGVILTIFMAFWTWAKGLEDGFDRANRKNLRLFIDVSENDKESEAYPLPSADRDGEDVSDEEEEKPPKSSLCDKHYYLYSDPAPTGVTTPLVNRKELVRINSCAIFHKRTHGKGVPHTFIGFIRRWPALPRVVVFLSVCVLPVPRVDQDDRYAVTKVRSIEGFYGVTYYLGFREDFEAQVDAIVDEICKLEARNTVTSSAVVNEVREASQDATHIVPHYNIISRRKYSGRFGAAGNWVRSFLIESIYDRIQTMFPETANWLTSSDEIIRVGINASV